MPKIPTKYYEVDDFKVTECGFNPARSEASESIFALSNEYMGVRGFFDEEYSAPQLIGTYFNGIYEVPKHTDKGGYLGISKKGHFMVNAVNWLYTKIYIDGQLVDLNKIAFSDFTRSLDFKTGELVRKFTCLGVTITFKRLLDMVEYQNAYQVMEFKAVKPVHLKLVMGLDYTIKHFQKDCFWNSEMVEQKANGFTVLGTTKKTKQTILTAYNIHTNVPLTTNSAKDIYTSILDTSLEAGKTLEVEKRVVHFKQSKAQKVEDIRPYQAAHASNQQYFANLWSNYDIKIEGDPLNQQGIHFSLFELFQTYLGLDPNNNIGAKGLTGEAYSGHAFWDSETYCLPFYIFNNPQAARNLLMWRYNKLANAKARAKELDCQGACYPIATLNGDEACNLWQHASLQLQPTTAVCYGIWHYVKNTHDMAFLEDYGLEILLECSRFLASRGSWNNNHQEFSFYGVMGPDEFQMMVNDNTYTNYMGLQTFKFLLASLQTLKAKNHNKYLDFIKRFEVSESEISTYQNICEHMRILYDPQTQLFEQHKGYYDLPHVDIQKIPQTDFPLYAHWTYDRIYRNDMIKQPDVLMMMFLHNSDFTKEQKFANYNFYEPRTIHESSLSPSIHSVLALELGKSEEGLKFFDFATRMDLDDYNRNTCEGIHTTSIAAAWVNIVYGFGGMRSDTDILSFSPTIPAIWQSYSFKIQYLNSHISVTVNKQSVTFKVSEPVELKIYNHIYIIKDQLTVDLAHV